MIILAAALGIVAFAAGAGLAEACYPDLVCLRCGEIMPGAGHACEGGERVTGIDWD